MTIASELIRIKNAKAAIYNAILSKGGTLSETQLISEYAAAINDITTTTGESITFYKCAAVYGPEKNLLGYEVSGITSPADANGTYELTELKSGTGGTVYKHSEKNYYYFKTNHWGFGTDYSVSDCWSTFMYNADGTWWTDGMDPNGVMGGYSGNGPTITELVETIDRPKTWDGYKAVLNTDGIYTFEETLTTGLSYSDIKPDVDKIYSENLYITVSNLYMGKILNDFNAVFLVRALNGNAVEEINNITPTLNGDVSQTSGVITFNKGYLNYATAGLNKLNFGKDKDFTVEYVTAIKQVSTSYPSVISNRTRWTTGTFAGIRFGNFADANSGYKLYWNPGDPFLSESTPTTSYGETVYRHQAVVRKGSRIMLFVEGKLVAETTKSDQYLNFSDGDYGEGIINLGTGTWDGDDGYFYGNMLWLRISNVARYDSDFTPEEFWYDTGADDDTGGGNKTYLYTLAGCSNADVNGDYWDVSDEYERFYDSEGNVVDSILDATYAFDGIYTNGKCFIAFNCTGTQITNGTPITQEKLYWFDSVYITDIINSDGIANGFIFANYTDTITIRCSGVHSSETAAEAYNGDFTLYRDDVSNDGGQVFKHITNDESYLFQYNGKWWIGNEYGWNHGDFCADTAVSTSWSHHDGDELEDGMTTEYIKG